MNEAESLVVLLHIAGLGPVTTHKLLVQYGSASAILQRGDKLISEWLLSASVAQQLMHWREAKQWRQDLELVEKLEVDLIPCSDTRYPSSLRVLADAPTVLYVKGAVTPKDQQAIAIVGTRNNTLYGNEMAKKFARELTLAGYTIVSGLARGIDTAAHVATVQQGGRTIAVIGSGLARLYPKENSALAESIGQNGAVISEFPMAMPPDRQNFPQRNRLVSALSLGVLLIEAPLNSGALITLNRAKQQNKAIFALPARVDMPSFCGNHAWIKSGAAALVETGQDIVHAFEDLFPARDSTEKKQKRNTWQLLPQEQMVYDCMPSMEFGMDELCLLTKLSSMELNALLMSLQLKKAVQVFPGAFYKKVEL